MFPISTCSLWGSVQLYCWVHQEPGILILRLPQQRALPVPHYSERRQSDSAQVRKTNVLSTENAVWLFAGKFSALGKPLLFSLEA